MIDVNLAITRLLGLVYAATFETMFKHITLGNTTNWRNFVGCIGECIGLVMV